MLLACDLVHPHQVTLIPPTGNPHPRITFENEAVAVAFSVVQTGRERAQRNTNEISGTRQVGRFYKTSWPTHVTKGPNAQLVIYFRLYFFVPVQLINLEFRYKKIPSRNKYSVAIWALGWANSCWDRSTI